MSGKSRKSAASRRTAPDKSAASASPNASPGVVSRGDYAATSPARRSPALFWIAGVAAGLLALYFLLLLLAPTALPNWLRGISPTSTAVTPQPAGGAGRISFVRQSNGGKQRDLFVVNPDGSGQVQVTNGLYIEGIASWSPDGTQVILQASIDGISTVVRLTV